MILLINEHLVSLTPFHDLKNPQQYKNERELHLSYKWYAPNIFNRESLDSF